MRFSEDDLITPVHAKHPDDPSVPVCYCFGETTRSIAGKVRSLGTGSVTGDIAFEVEAGHCACGVRDPKGSCCLGDAAKVEKEQRWQPEER